MTVRILLKYSALLATILFAFFASVLVSFAAEVSIAPSTGTYSTGQTFTVNVRVNPQGKSVNAVESSLTFDTSKLSVVNVSKTGSAFSLWTTEPTFSNTAGTIDFGGGSPTPFSASSNLISITFRAVAEGTVSVDFKSTQVLAADGMGTDVFSGAVKGTFTISAAAAPTPTETPEPEPEPEPEDEGDDNAAITFGDPPLPPEISSKTFLDPDVWYATSTGLFTWELPFDVNAVAIDISTSSDSDPETIYDPPVSEFMLDDGMLQEGVQFLHVKYQNQVGWGAPTHRKLQIDTKPPRPFTINVRAGNTPDAFPLLIFEAPDDTSGIDHYELVVADREPVPITPDEAQLGYLLSELVNGTYTVTVTAYDRAGNMTIASTPILITSGWQPPKEDEGKNPFLALLSFNNLFIAFLILLVCALCAYIYYEQKQFSRKETRLRKETKEIQDQMEKIFSALRDEIHDQIQAITKKPRLSKTEREAVEGLESALEVSETLIEKEIVDVQKILK